KCYAHCLKHVTDGHKAHLKSMKLCLDCADFCALCLKICGRGGAMSEVCCKACAEACDRCAAECENFKDDEVMAACAQACRDCAKSCKSCCAA
ncbi:MAG: four-helix bundle copper-binding protein, partial [Planctomycetia bacterium]